MGKLYNEVAGRDLGRLAALSDGIFAFAMTLLVLNIRVPEPFDVRNEGELGHALLRLGPSLLTCVMTFLTLGIFWVAQQTQLNALRSADRGLAWLHIGFMFAVVLMPFSTAVLASFITYRLAILIYWANIAFLGLMLFLSSLHAYRHSLMKEPFTFELIVRRIASSQSLYAIAAMLCFVNTWLSIGLIFAVQLNYVFAPRIPWLYRF
ncbi:MAG TPA: TMEM175 family protein [Verrucomicrobiae bacterium]|nr:TMEM175 family protein [Verrucomicrobiae bacterium]